MLTPDDRLAGAAISSFIPQLLFGLSAVDLGAGTLTLTLAEDFNQNFLPDADTEQTLPLVRDAQGLWQGTQDAFPIQVRDSSEALVGTLSVYDARWTLHSADDGLSITALTEGHLQGDIISAELVGIIRSVAGIDVNGTEALIKQIYKLPSDEPLPERLPIWFKFLYARAD